MSSRANSRPLWLLVWAAMLVLLGGATCPSSTPSSPAPAPEAPHVIGLERGNGQAATVYQVNGKRYEGVLPASSVKVKITPLPLEVDFDVTIDGVAVPRVNLDQLRGDDAKWALDYDVATTGSTETLIIMPQAAQRHASFLLTIGSRRAGLTSPPIALNIGFFGYKPFVPQVFSGVGGTPSPPANEAEATAKPCGTQTPNGKLKEFQFDQKCLGNAFPPIPAQGCTREEARHRARELLQYACHLTEIEDEPIVPDPPPPATPQCTAKTFKFCVTCDDGSHAPNISPVSADACTMEEAEARIAGARPFFCTIAEGKCSP